MQVDVQIIGSVVPVDVDVGPQVIDVDAVFEHSIKTDSHEDYPGPYEVTPGEEAQTLAVRDLVTTQDIVIAAIPSNYGRVLWDGATLKVY